MYCVGCGVGHNGCPGAALRQTPEPQTTQSSSFSLSQLELRRGKVRSKHRYNIPTLTTVPPTQQTSSKIQRINDIPAFYNSFIFLSHFYYQPPPPTTASHHLLALPVLINRDPHHTTTSKATSTHGAQATPAEAPFTSSSF